MSSIRITKRKDVYQYRFEIASENGKRKYINKKKTACQTFAILFFVFYNKNKY